MQKEMAKSDVNKKSVPVAGRIIWIVLIIQLLVIGWLLIKQLTQKTYKLGYVEISKVYDEFSLTKKLNADFTKMQTARQSQLDTLKFIIQNLQVEIDAGHNDKVQECNRLKEQYVQLEEQINNDNVTVQNKYLEQISTQLNSLVKEYGEKHHYDIIFGANGEGGIMHGNEALNITEDVIVYINQSVE